MAHNNQKINISSEEEPINSKYNKYPFTPSFLQLHKKL